MHLFSKKSQTEEVVLTFDFSDQLNGDVIASISSITPELASGADPYVAGLLSGSGTISVDGQSVAVLCVGGVNGNDYLITAKVQTATEKLELAGLLPLRKST